MPTARPARAGPGPATSAALAALLACALGLSRAHGATGDVPFRDATVETGLSFAHDNGARGDYFLPEIMGSGAALFDYDGDGDLDVFLVQGGPLVPPAAAGRPNASAKTSRLLRNDLRVDRAGRRTVHFTDVTEAAHLGLVAAGMGAATGDYDGDGDLDLYVTTFGSNVLYRNNGDGTFTDVTGAAGVDDPRWSTSAAFLDYDRDGDLDLFVVNYVDFTTAGNKICTDPVGARDYCSPSAYRPVPARLFRNEGRGAFVDVSEAAGITRAYGAGLGVAVGDYNGDGWLDLYVANDATPNQLWLNTHAGTFEDQGWLSGSAASAAGRPEGSMGIASADYDEDGSEDLFVTNLSRETFVLYRNDGRGNFDDRRADAGVAATTADMTGFGTAWIDYDNDGRLDLVIANGAVNIIAALRGSGAPYRQHNQLFHNEGGGRLRDVTAAAGPAFEGLDVGRAVAVGDLDNDGGVDVLVTNNGGAARLLLNQGAPARGVLVRLRVPEGNRWGVGARVGLVRRDGRTAWRRVGSAGSYLAASDLRVHFGLGSPADVQAFVVEWPDGERERWSPRAETTVVTLERGTGTRDPGVQPPR